MKQDTKDRLSLRLSPLTSYRLHTAYKSAGFRSMNELAERVGISNVNLSKIKNNKVTAIRFSTLAAICGALDCQPGDILEFQKEG